MKFVKKQNKKKTIAFIMNNQKFGLIRNVYYFKSHSAHLYLFTNKWVLIHLVNGVLNYLNYKVIKVQG